MSGCLYTSGRTVRDTGPRISENSVRAVELNKSTIDWVVTTFGEPSSRACTLDGAEILRYDCDVRTTEGSYFLMLAASSTNTIERTCWWFEARDGKITPQPSKIGRAYYVHPQAQHVDELFNSTRLLSRLD
jgi:hypothetical protein